MICHCSEEIDLTLKCVFNENLLSLVTAFEVVSYSFVELIVVALSVKLFEV